MCLFSVRHSYVQMKVSSYWSLFHYEVIRAYMFQCSTVEKLQPNLHAHAVAHQEVLRELVKPAKFRVRGIQMYTASGLRV